MRRLLLCAALAVSAPAAARADAPFTAALRSRFLSLDPAALYDLTSFSIAGNVYEPLVRFAPRRTDLFEPHLIKRVPTEANGLLSKDGKTYRFEIRPGVYFHDGTLLRAVDVAYSLKRFMIYDRPGGPSHLLLRPIMGLESTHDRNYEETPLFTFEEMERRIRVEGDVVVVTLAERSDTFLKVLASWPFVMSRDWAIQNGDWDGTERTWKEFSGETRPTPLDRKANGTGPFKLGKIELDGDYVVLDRHDSYWREPAKLDAVHLRVVDSEALRLLMLQAGDADFAYLERPGFRYLEGQPGLNVLDDMQRLKTGDVLFFTFDIAKDSPYIGSGALDGGGITPDFFKDPDVREAFQHVFDHKRYLDMALEGKGAPARGPVPESLREPYKKWDVFKFDYVRAGKLLQKAHLGKIWDKGFEFGIGFNMESESRRVAAEALRDGLKIVAPRFKVTLHPLPRDAFLKAFRARALPMFVSGFTAEYPDPYPFLHAFYHSRGFYAEATGFGDPKVDKRLAEIHEELDPKKRLKLIRKLEEDAHERSWQIHTHYPLKFMALRDSIAGLDREQNVNGLESRGLLYYYPLYRRK